MYLSSGMIKSYNRPFVNIYKPTSVPPCDLKLVIEYPEESHYDAEIIQY